jgi:UDP-4-amino-4-deoxy-L-arabinose formyltransferase/UDP-glucuronic acid dehydrogenase (UDP-4-keto-hexauronic acid decarboxylating)
MTRRFQVFFVGDAVGGRPILARIEAQANASVVGLAGSGAAIEAAARTKNIPVFDAKLLNRPDTIAAIAALAPDVIINFNSVVIFSEALLAVPARGAINFHPGPLPEYAGLHPGQWAIIHGETEFGVTMHYMEKGIDTGAILGLERFPIEANDTGLSVFLKAIRTGAGLVADITGRLAAGEELPGTPQDRSRRRYYGKNIARGGVIDFSWPAGQVVNFVRALSYRPFASPTVVPTTTHAGQTLEAVAVEAVPGEERPDAPSGTILSVTPAGPLIACGAGAVRMSRFFLRGQIVPAAVLMESLPFRAGGRLGSGSSSS